MISLRHNFLFVHIPKTAGNSIQKILQTYSEDILTRNKLGQDGIDRFGVISEEYGTEKHSTLQDYKSRIEETVFTNLFKFTCVRNSWDRLISYFFSAHQEEISVFGYEFGEKWSFC